jgi:hypothetical protein
VGKTGAFSIRVTQGRNSFAFNGVMDASGVVRIPIPSNFYPYASKSNNNYGYGSSAYPAFCTLSLVNGINFNFGDQVGSGMYQTSPLSKAASPTVVASLASKRFNASLTSGYNYGMTLPNSPGFASYDIGNTGVVLCSGMVNVNPSSGNSGLPMKTVRYTFSSPLVMESVYVSSGSSKLVPAVNFTSIGTPTDIGIIGDLNLNDSSLTGSFTASQFVTGPLDPNYGSNSYNGNYYSNFNLVGYAYTAPKVGQTPLPFLQPSRLNFSAFMGDLPIGTLSLVNLRPTFRTAVAGTSSVSQGLALRAAAMSALTTNGAFSGTVITVGTGSATRATSRTFTGVLLQGGTQVGVGLTTDGLPVSFQ